MFKNLENYLQEINHYLAVKGSPDEVLAEIKSHILERAEDEFGEVSEETVKKIISRYGRPQDVAAKYIEGYEIISPTLKKHLLVYTGIFFAFHFLMSLIALILQQSMVVFPFFYIPRMDTAEALFYLPMALVFDLGLVGLFLYFVTQKNKNLRLPWPKKFGVSGVQNEPRRPKLIFLFLLILALGGFLYIFLRYGAIFLASLESGRMESLLNPEATKVYGLLFLALLSCEVVGYAVRFFNNSWWVSLFKNAAVLILLWVIWNRPVETAFKEVPGIDMQSSAEAFVILLILLAAFSFLRSVFHVARQKL